MGLALAAVEIVLRRSRFLPCGVAQMTSRANGENPGQQKRRSTNGGRQPNLVFVSAEIKGRQSQTAGVKRQGSDRRDPERPRVPRSGARDLSKASGARLLIDRERCEAGSGGPLFSHPRTTSQRAQVLTMRRFDTAHTGSRSCSSFSTCSTCIRW